jgi:chemotaxis protein MotB
MKPLSSVHRRPKSEESSPLWLIVLCDMMTILMLFFLMMFSYTYQPEKAAELARTFAVGEIIEAPKESKPELPAVPPPPEMVDEIKRLLSDRGLSDSVEVLETESAVRVRLRESILFKTAGAELDPRSGKTLKILAGVLNEIPNEVVKEGHTDNVPITKARYRSNWELSVARSYAVIKDLRSYGVSPERLVAAGYGEYHPIDNNATRNGRAKNRRVELVILRPGAEG